MLKNKKALKQYIEETFHVKIQKVKVPLIGTYYVILEYEDWICDGWYELKTQTLFYNLSTIYDYLYLEANPDEEENEDEE